MPEGAMSPSTPTQTHTPPSTCSISAAISSSSFSSGCVMRGSLTKHMAPKSFHGRRAAALQTQREPQTQRAPQPQPALPAAAMAPQCPAIAPAPVVPRAAAPWDRSRRHERGRGARRAAPAGLGVSEGRHGLRAAGTRRGHGGYTAGTQRGRPCRCGAAAAGSPLSPEPSPSAHPPFSPQEPRPEPRAPHRPPEAAGHGGGGCHGDGEAERERAEVRAEARPRREGAAICRLLRGFIAFAGVAAEEGEGATRLNQKRSLCFPEA